MAARTGEAVSGPLEELRAAMERAKRVAAYYGFAFYIAGGTRYEYAGRKSEEREATEEERKMWYQLDELAPRDWILTTGQ